MRVYDLMVFLWKVMRVCVCVWVPITRRDVARRRGGSTEPTAVVRWVSFVRLVGRRRGRGRAVARCGAVRNEPRRVRSLRT